MIGSHFDLVVAFARKQHVVCGTPVEKTIAETAAGDAAAPKPHTKPGHCRRDRGGNRHDKTPEGAMECRPQRYSEPPRQRLGNALVLRLPKHVADQGCRLP